MSTSPPSDENAKVKDRQVDDLVKVTHNVKVQGHDDEPFRPGLTAPQFGTRELLAFVFFIAIGLAALKVLDPMVSAGLILLGLCIFAHVAGNAVGMKLRDGGPAPKSESSAPLRSSDYAPTTRLSLHKRLGRLTLVFTILGAVIGATGGGGLLAFVNWENITLANMSLATTSCAVLGGLFGFWLSSFLQVFLQAWAEAHKNADPERR